MSFNILNPALYLEAHFMKNGSIHLVFRDKTGKTFIEELKKMGRKQEMINKLSPLDAYRVGFLLASEELTIDY